MKVTLISHTPDPERVVAAAARNCYSDIGAASLYESLDDAGVLGLIKKLGKLGHYSPFEHASFTFGVEGVSRTLLAQITRHRIASFSVKSQRYVGEHDFAYIVPPKIAENEAASKIYENLMARIAEDYKKLAETVEIEDARYVLPGSCATSIVTTMNARALHNFFALRCCNRAQWEIHDLAFEMLRLVHIAAPALFVGAGPGCVTGTCPEGSMTCGKADQMREKCAGILQSW